MIEFIHEDYFDSKGNQIPSVTNVIGILNKPQLLSWANSLGFYRRSVKYEQEKAALIGSLTHHYLEKLSKNNLCKMKSLNSYSDIIRIPVKQCIKNYISFREIYHQKTKYAELRLQTERVGGTIDNICKIDSKKYIIDYKTSGAIYPTMFLQLAGYVYLCRLNGINNIDYVAILRLDKKKDKFEFKRMSVEHLKNYELVFMALLNVFELWESQLDEDSKSLFNSKTSLYDK